MPAPASPTFLLNWVNIWYKDLDNVHCASILASPTFSRMTWQKTGGDSVAQPFELSGHAGESGDFQAAQTISEQASYGGTAKYRWNVPYPEYHGALRVNHRDIALSRNDKDAATKALQHEFDRAFKQRASNLARLLYAPLGASLGSATLASGVLTFSDRFIAGKLFRGRVISLSTTDGTTGSVVGQPGFVVKSESEVAASNTGRVSISGTSEGAVGNPAGVPDGTYNVFMYGEFNSSDPVSSKMISLQAYWPATPATTDLFNVARAHDTRLSGMRVPDAAYAGQSLATKIKRWVAHAVNLAGSALDYDTLALNPVDWQQAEEDFSSTISRELTSKGEDGFMSLVVNTARGPLEILSEPHCPQGLGIVMTKNQLTFHSPTGYFAEWMPVDGKNGDLIRRKESSPSYEMNPVSYIATVLKAPWTGGRLNVNA